MEQIVAWHRALPVSFPRSRSTERPSMKISSQRRRRSSGSESDSPSRSRSRSRSRFNSPSKSSRRINPSPPPVDSYGPSQAPVELPAAGTGWASPMLEGKVLFIFFRFAINSRFPFCLVRVSLPGLADATETIYDMSSPVLEFPAKDFPMDMRCVELDSKFYFLGGELHPPLCTVPNPKYSCYLPPEVYVVDADTLADAAAGDTIDHPFEVLKPVSPMKSGKPEPYLFAACGKIYVIAGNDEVLCDNSEFDDYVDEYGDYVVFESYDPKRNKWSELPDPPTEEFMSGHAVVDREVILVTSRSNIFSFNVDARAWKRFSAPLPSPLLENFVFDTRGEVVDGTLYCCCNSTEPPAVVAYCKCDDESKGLFDRAALLSPEIELQTMEHSGYMAHLGGLTFCHVDAGTAPLLYEPEVKYWHKLGIRLTLLEVGETYKATSQFGDEHYFGAKLLQDAYLIIPSGELPLIKGCFVVSSRGIVAAK